MRVIAFLFYLLIPILGLVNHAYASSQPHATIGISTKPLANIQLAASSTMEQYASLLDIDDSDMDDDTDSDFEEETSNNGPIKEINKPKVFPSSYNQQCFSASKLNCAFLFNSFLKKNNRNRCFYTNTTSVYIANGTLRI